MERENERANGRDREEFSTNIVSFRNEKSTTNEVNSLSPSSRESLSLVAIIRCKAEHDGVVIRGKGRGEELFIARKGKN